MGLGAFFRGGNGYLGFFLALRGGGALRGWEGKRWGEKGRVVEGWKGMNEMGFNQGFNGAR